MMRVTEWRDKGDKKWGWNDKTKRKILGKGEKEKKTS